MSISIEYTDQDSKGMRTSLDRYPDNCPVCGKGIEPLAVGAFGSRLFDAHEGLLQVAFRCPRKDCQKLFIAYYTHRGGSTGEPVFLRESTLPFVAEKESFDEEIYGVSPDFVEIYNQAKTAEEGGLIQICGPGYRKALEFLIKDYLIHLNPEREGRIKEKKLGLILKEDVESKKIAQIATRAWWLGHDETHYYRKWKDMDIQDLKSLIRVTVHWIVDALIAEEYVSRMPEKTPQKEQKV